MLHFAIGKYAPEKIQIPDTFYAAKLLIPFLVFRMKE